MIIEPTKNEKRELKNLIEYKGWHILCKFLDNDIASLTAKISEDDGIKRDEEERRVLIETRQAFKKLREYPEKLLEEPKQQSEPENQDPYDPYPNNEPNAD